MFINWQQAQAFIRENQFAMIDFKFGDLAGRWHHVTLPAGQFNEALMRDGWGLMLPLSVSSR